MVGIVEDSKASNQVGSRQALGDETVVIVVAVGKLRRSEDRSSNSACCGYAVLAWIIADRTRLIEALVGPNALLVCCSNLKGPVYDFV